MYFCLLLASCSLLFTFRSPRMLHWMALIPAASVHPVAIICRSRVELFLLLPAIEEVHSPAFRCSVVVQIVAFMDAGLLQVSVLAKQLFVAFITLLYVAVPPSPKTIILEASAWCLESIRPPPLLFTAFH